MKDVNIISAVSNGSGLFIQVEQVFQGAKVHKILEETNIIGAGYYNDLTIKCYTAYSYKGKKLISINTGTNVEVYYKH